MLMFVDVSQASDSGVDVNGSFSKDGVVKNRSLQELSNVSLRNASMYHFGIIDLNFSFLKKLVLLVNPWILEQ